MPAELKPTVQVIDDWFTARKLGLIFEAKVKSGKLVVCSIDLDSNLDTNPVARQMRTSILDYMNGPKFSPRLEVSTEKLENLLFQTKSKLTQQP